MFGSSRILSRVDAHSSGTHSRISERAHAEFGVDTSTVTAGIMPALPELSRLCNLSAKCCRERQCVDTVGPTTPGEGTPDVVKPCHISCHIERRWSSDR